MFKDFIQSIYEKVYIINFDKCSQIPCLTNEELKKLGKWYVSTGKEWICHSDYELEEFKNIFLNFISPEERDNICLLYTSPSPRDLSTSRMPSSA